MISLNDGQRRQYLEWVANNELMQQAFYSVMAQQPNRIFDGFIHSSKLDWTKPYAQQFEAHLKNYNANPATNGYTRAGDIYHEDLQRFFNTFFGTQNAFPEYKFKYDNIRLQGSIDRLQLGTPIGNVLIEIKSTSTLQKDKTGGDSIINKLFKCKDTYGSSDWTLGTILTVNPTWMQLEKEIVSRLRCKPRLIKPEENHQTQMFTYAWAMSYQLRLDWLCLLYVARDTYEITEFWYPVNTPETQEKIKRAATNFYGVQQCLMKYLQRQQTGSTGQVSA